jgi:hypothetical protein
MAKCKWLNRDGCNNPKYTESHGCPYKDGYTDLACNIIKPRKSKYVRVKAFGYAGGIVNLGINLNKSGPITIRIERRYLK